MEAEYESHPSIDDGHPRIHLCRADGERGRFAPPAARISGKGTAASRLRLVRFLCRRQWRLRLGGGAPPILPPAEPTPPFGMAAFLGGPPVSIFKPARRGPPLKGAR